MEWAACVGVRAGGRGECETVGVRGARGPQLWGQ